MSEVLLSFKDVTVRVPGEQSFPIVNFELKETEHWAFVGENEGLKTALIEAIAGNASVIGRAEFPFFETYKAQLQSDPLLSPQRFIIKIAERHHFRNLSNTSQFYYQQRFNSTDSEDAVTVQEYLESIPAIRELPIDVEAVVNK